MKKTSRIAENYYIMVTDSTVKLTYVKSVPDKGCKVGIREEKNEKRVSNVSRARTEFLDLGQSNKWDWMGTMTSGTEGMNYTADIRGIQEFIHNYNHHHGCKIKYLIVFELGEKGRRLHAHMLLRDVPESFLRPYTPEEYKKLPADVKRLYSQYKTETGTKLCTCPSWKFGWSTMIPTDGSPKVVSYMTKYMTKGNVEFTTAFGGHAYFSSHGLKRPEKKKIPSSAVAAAFERIPSGTWFHECKLDSTVSNWEFITNTDRTTGKWTRVSKPNETVVSSCFMLDKDKISPELWEYYNSLYGGLQGRVRPCKTE